MEMMNQNKVDDPSVETEAGPVEEVIGFLASMACVFLVYLGGKAGRLLSWIGNLFLDVFVESIGRLLCLLLAPFLIWQWRKESMENDRE